MEVRSPEWQSQRSVLIGVLPGGSEEEQRERLEGLLGALRSKAPEVEVRVNSVPLSHSIRRPAVVE